MDKVAIYILKLADDKYYIGKCRKNNEIDVNKRIRQHFNKKGAAWTKKHPPVSIVNIKYDMDKYDEDKWTKIYMDKYGIENVRGGIYVRLRLSNATIKTIQNEIIGSNDRCHNCGETGHYIKNCPKRKQRLSPPVIQPDLYDQKILPPIEEMTEEDTEEKTVGNGEEKTVGNGEEKTVGNGEEMNVEDTEEDGDSVTVWQCNICKLEYSDEYSADKCIERHTVFDNLCGRFKTYNISYIAEICKRYNYHGGLVAQFLNKEEDRKIACMQR